MFCSDGEPNLVLAEFDQFLSDNNIRKRRSSAGYPQSNGVAEKAVQSFKRLYEKKERDNEPWPWPWALWRDTPQEPGQLSPERTDGQYGTRGDSTLKCPPIQILWLRPRRISGKDWKWRSTVFPWATTDTQTRRHSERRCFGSGSCADFGRIPGSVRGARSP